MPTAGRDEVPRGLSLLSPKVPVLDQHHTPQCLPSELEGATLAVSSMWGRLSLVKAKLISYEIDIL